MKNIDLAVPSEGSVYDGAIPTSVNGPQYPTVHLEGYDDLDLPESGTIIFQYRQKRETTTKEKNGKVRYECTLELTKLTGTKGSGPKSPTKSGSEAGDALDKLAAEHSSKQDEGY